MPQLHPKFEPRLFNSQEAFNTFCSELNNADPTTFESFIFWEHKDRQTVHKYSIRPTTQSKQPVFDVFSDAASLFEKNAQFLPGHQSLLEKIHNKVTNSSLKERFERLIQVATHPPKENERPQPPIACLTAIQKQILQKLDALIIRCKRELVCEKKLLSPPNKHAIFMFSDRTCTIALEKLPKTEFFSAWKDSLKKNDFSNIESQDFFHYLHLSKHPQHFDKMMDLRRALTLWMIADYCLDQQLKPLCERYINNQTDYEPILDFLKSDQLPQTHPLAKMLSCNLSLKMDLKDSLENPRKLLCKELPESNQLEFEWSIPLSTPKHPLQETQETYQTKQGLWTITISPKLPGKARETLTVKLDSPTNELFQLKVSLINSAHSVMLESKIPSTSHQCPIHLDDVRAKRLANQHAGFLPIKILITRESLHAST